MNNNVLSPKIVLGIAAHPDDLDFGAAGAFATWADAGAKVYYLLLTDGSKGSDDENMTSEKLIGVREKEQRNAAKVIGAKEAFFLRYPDGMLEVTMELKQKICMYIRKLKPDVVVTTDPTFLYSAEMGIINHPDHRAAGQAAIDSVFPLARDRLSFPELLKNGYFPHKVETLLLINFEKRNFFVDISNSLNKKLLALKAHASQISDWDSAEERIRQRASNTGGNAGFKFAEGFLRINLMG